MLRAVRAEISRRELERTRKDADRIRERCRTLPGFIKEAWHVLEPKAVYVQNWSIDAICEHLEAVTKGQITRLLTNVPPGTMKSLSTSVFWPAWEWGPMGMRSMRYLATAFNDKPVTRDSRKCRDLILSDWYQTLWPEVKLVRAGETSFANSDTGTREGVPFTSLTSQRGNRLIIDDPHSTETAESPAERENTTRRFREGALNRLNNQERDAILIIMQRLHEDDVSGVALALKMGYVHLMLPMEFEPERACRTVIGFKDPRKKLGELLDPVRFPRQVVEDLKRDMGSYAWAGQYQQRPAPREGGMFKRAWFEGKRVPVPPAKIIKTVRRWDFAASTGTRSARSAGVKMSLMENAQYIVQHVEKLRAEGDIVRRTVKSIGERDGKNVPIRIPQDPGQAGKVQVKDYISFMAGWDIRGVVETGSKEVRAQPFSAQCEGGNVWLLEDENVEPWIDDYLDELCMFPGGTYKDQVDASSGAFAELLVGVEINSDFTGPKVIRGSR